MSIEIRTFTCIKCGKKFTTTVGGIVPSERELVLDTRPMCGDCKMDQVINIGMKGISTVKKIVKQKH